MSPLQSRPADRTVAGTQSGTLLPPYLLRVCPECAGPLARASACVTCLRCGWGRCG